MNKLPTNIKDLDFADTHCHMLAGVDDGADTLHEMMRMAARAKSEGIGIICFTPHSGLFGKDIDPEHLKGKFACATDLLRKSFPDIRFYLGSEIYYSCDIPEKLQKGTYLPINGGKYVLVEFPPNADLFIMENGVKFITTAGYTPILAHIERYKIVCNNPLAIKRLREKGAVIQSNSRQIMRRNLLGRNPCIRLLRQGLIDIIATDCHDVAERPPEMRKCYEYIKNKFGRKYADTLTKINPRLVLANKAIIRLRF